MENRKQQVIGIGWGDAAKIGLLREGPFERVDNRGEFADPTRPVGTIFFERAAERRLARATVPSLSVSHDHHPARIWLYLRFTLSYRDVEELLAERRLDVSYETVRRWVLKFGPLIACELRRRQPRPSSRWHLDEMVVRIAGRRM